MGELISDDLVNMARGLMELYDIAYEQVKPKVQYLIVHHVQDMNVIDHIFDEVLNIPTEKAYQLYLQLCNYVATFNPKEAKEYIDLYYDLYGLDEEKHQDNMISSCKSNAIQYFQDGDVLLSDFDGVFLDSQKEFLKVMKNETSTSLWTEYLNSINWRDFLRQCDEIPEASSTFLGLQKMGILKGFITRIHSFEEGKEKSAFIREKGLFVPIYYVLPDQAKSMVYVPNQHTILLEDKYENALDWDKNGGRSIVYDPTTEEESPHLVKKISHLLRK